MKNFWRKLKLRFVETISNTRAELKLNKDDDANEYVINGVRYIVSTRFCETENKTMKEKLSEFIGGDFAHLTTTQDTNTINTEYVNSTAGERRTNAVG